MITIQQSGRDIPDCSPKINDTILNANSAKCVELDTKYGMILPYSSVGQSRQLIIARRGFESRYSYHIIQTIFCMEKEKSRSCL